MLRGSEVRSEALAAFGATFLPPRSCPLSGEDRDRPAVLSDGCVHGRWGRALVHQLHRRLGIPIHPGEWPFMPSLATLPYLKTVSSSSFLKSTSQGRGCSSVSAECT